MKCPRCELREIVKNSWRQDKQNYLCRNCHRQFVDIYDEEGCSQDTKDYCLTLYCNGMGRKQSFPAA